MTQTIFLTRHAWVNLMHPDEISCVAGGGQVLEQAGFLRSNFVPKITQVVHAPENLCRQTAIIMNVGLGLKDPPIADEGFSPASVMLEVFGKEIEAEEAVQNSEYVRRARSRINGAVLNLASKMEESGVLATLVVSFARYGELAYIGSLPMWISPGTAVRHIVEGGVITRTTIELFGVLDRGQRNPARQLKSADKMK